MTYIYIYLQYLLNKTLEEIGQFLEICSKISQSKHTVMQREDPIS